MTKTEILEQLKEIFKLAVSDPRIKPEDITPESNLTTDLEMTKNMHEKSGTTVILVSHSMEDVAKYVDRVLVMNQGELLYDDLTKAVFGHSEELEHVGLAAPQITYIMNDLKRKGFDVDVTSNTIEEGCNSILQAIRKRRI